MVCGWVRECFRNGGWRSCCRFLRFQMGRGCFWWFSGRSELCIGTFVVYREICSVSIDFVLTDHHDFVEKRWLQNFVVKNAHTTNFVIEKAVTTNFCSMMFLSLSIDFVDYSDICRHFCSVLLCSEPIYWLCWLFRYLWALLTCFIMFWTHLFDYTDICRHFWHVLLCSEPIYLTIPISVGTFDMFYYVLNPSIWLYRYLWTLLTCFIMFWAYLFDYWHVLLCSESIYWTIPISVDTFVVWAYLLTLLTIPISVDTFEVFYYVLSLSIDFVDFLLILL